MTSKIETVQELATLIREQRKKLSLTQADLAGASGLGIRFIGDLERGKQTCEIGKTLTVLAMLGLELELSSRTPDND